MPIIRKGIAIIARRRARSIKAGQTKKASIAEIAPAKPRTAERVTRVLDMVFFITGKRIKESAKDCNKKKKEYFHPF